MVESGTIQDLLQGLADRLPGLLPGLVLVLVAVLVLVLMVAPGLAALRGWLVRPGATHGAPEAPQGDNSGAALLYRNGILIDATPAGHALLADIREDSSEWAGLAQILGARFPAFPQVLSGVDRPHHRTFRAQDAQDPEFVAIQQWDNMARVTLLGPGHGWKALRNTGTAPAGDHGESSIAEAPYPVWQSNSIGQLVWANRAYFRLANTLGITRADPEIPVLFDPSAQTQQSTPTRISVADKTGNGRLWFDVWTLQKAGLCSHYASPADAIVNAEIAQRNFVQTLTKTFAQLSIGLAIFDRNRQLALFNPALIDLTSLPADFLSARPSLLSFFDRMRENRMMPEPRNYATWREQIAKLVVAASDDRYADTWTLPSGVTYRVLGRPHPDGAIAFLFEDISAEVSLTRRFRTELELGQATLDSVRDALVVFSPTGKLSLCNRAYRQMWSCEPEQSLDEYGLQDAMQLWRAGSQRTDAWEKLRHHVLDLTARDSWSASVTLESGGLVNLRVTSLHAGYTSVLFEPARGSGGAVAAAEMMTG